MKKFAIYSIALILAATAFATAQSNDAGTDDLQHMEKDLPEIDKFDFSLSTGVSVGSFGKGQGSFSSQYLFPKASIRINPKFDIKVGTLIENVNANTSFTSGMGSGIGNSPSGFMSFQGNYRFSDRLVVNSTVIKGFNQNQQNYFNAMSNINQLFQVGIDFKLTDNISIGASWSYMEYDGFLNNRFAQPLQTNPFYYNPGLY